MYTFMNWYLDFREMLLTSCLYFEYVIYWLRSSVDWFLYLFSNACSGVTSGNKVIYFSYHARSFELNWFQLNRTIISISKTFRIHLIFNILYICFIKILQVFQTIIKVPWTRSISLNCVAAQNLANKVIFCAFCCILYLL